MEIETLNLILSNVDFKIVRIVPVFEYNDLFTVEDSSGNMHTIEVFLRDQQINIYT